MVQQRRLIQYKSVTVSLLSLEVFGFNIVSKPFYFFRWRCVDKKCRKWYGWVRSHEEIPKVRNFNLHLLHTGNINYSCL